MKKWLWILGALAAAAVIGSKPSAGTDVGKLQPVQVVCIERADDNVIVWTDTGDQGVGEDFNAAVQDMKNAAIGEIFLETADHVLLSPGSLAQLENAASMLRPSCSVCLFEGELNLEQVGRFLEIHAPERTLMEYRAGLRKLQTLKSIDGRMTLVS